MKRLTKESVYVSALIDGYECMMQAGGELTYTHGGPISATCSSGTFTKMGNETSNGDVLVKVYP
jgi:hypothetical protein